MIEVDCETIHKMEEQLGLEGKLKLPVVVTHAGTLFVLDPDGSQAKVFSSGGGRRSIGSRGKRSGQNLLFKTSVKRIDTRTSSGRALRKTQDNPVRLVLRFPEVSAEAARAALKRTEAASKQRRLAHLIIDTGPGGFDWDRMLRFVTDIFSGQGEREIRTVVTIDGNIARPSKGHMDFIGRNRIVTRFILGSGLGYKKRIDSAAAGTFKAISEYGLRIPVLFYWSGEDRAKVSELLKKSLELNKLSGIGILPYFMSPRFDSRAKVREIAPDGFSEVLSFLHNDRLLCEFIEEPIIDIEQRLAFSPSARSNQYIISPTGRLLSFRRFPFAATGRLKASTYGPCRRCVWRCICGGIDSSPGEFHRQHKLAAQAWCVYRQVFMRRIAVECLDIREHLQQYKNQLMGVAS